MSDDLSPAEQARAARWAAEWLNDAGWKSQFAAASAAVDALKRKADELDPPESVESLRAERDKALADVAYWQEQHLIVCDEAVGYKSERDDALAEMEEVGAAWRQEQIMHQKAWATIRNLQAELADTRTDLHKANAEIYRLRAAIPVVEAAWERCKDRPARVWHKGDSEPKGVQRISGFDGGVWRKTADGLWGGGSLYSWAGLLYNQGTLTEVLSED